MAEDFQYDVFLSHSAKDKAVVCPLAERLQKDGLKVWSDEWMFCAIRDELRARWAHPGQRVDIIQQLAERRTDFPTVAAQAGKPDADPFDLLCHLAFNAPVLTRRQHADCVKQQETAFFKFFTPEAREILNDLLEKYASDGELQLTLPDVLKVQPISDHDNVNEIIGNFGGTNQLRNVGVEFQNPNRGNTCKPASSKLTCAHAFC